MLIEQLKVILNESIKYDAKFKTELENKVTKYVKNKISSIDFNNKTYIKELNKVLDSERKNIADIIIKTINNIGKKNDFKVISINSDILKKSIKFELNKGFSNDKQLEIRLNKFIIVDTLIDSISGEKISKLSTGRTSKVNDTARTSSQIYKSTGKGERWAYDGITLEFTVRI